MRKPDCRIRREKINAAFKNFITVHKAARTALIIKLIKPLL